MSSFIKAQKSNQKTHRERVNVLPKGFLERKKDYQNRAAEYNRRKDIFTKLRKKALDKNPDEFFFRMKSSQLIDGIHYDKRKDDFDDEDGEEMQQEELKLMQTQDLKYVNYKRMIDKNKIEKLRSELHWVDPDPQKPKNSHIFFVDDSKQKKRFDFAKRLQVDKDQFKNGLNFIAKNEEKNNQASEKPEELASNETKELKYRRLRNKIEREKFLENLVQKMQIKKQLLNKNETAKKVRKGTKNRPPVYQWKMERKK